MRDFEYIRAESVDHALGVLADLGESAVKLAGGQSLLNILKQGLLAPDYVVDIKGLAELDFIRFDAGSGFRIGALSTHASIEHSEEIARRCPVLAQMERHLASVQVRNWGTLGGNICIADPTSDAAPVLIALGAEAAISGRKGSRKLPLHDFFVDYYQTVLEPEELLTEVGFRPPGPGAAAAYEKLRNVEGDAPIVVSAAYLRLENDGRTCAEARVALGGVASTPIRATAAEDALKGRELTPEAVASAALLAAEAASPIPDIVASAEYKKDMAAVMTRRTLTRAADEAARSLKRKHPK